MQEFALIGRINTMCNEVVISIIAKIHCKKLDICPRKAQGAVRGRKAPVAWAGCVLFPVIGELAGNIGLDYILK